MRYYKNKWLLYAIIFSHNMVPAYVIERLFYKERGMTVQMVVYCEIVYAIAIIMLEIPSGVLADKVGRKHLIVLSSILHGFQFCALIFANTFWHFAIITFISGIGTAFGSGAYNALLYDSLKSCDRTNEFEGICGNMNAIDFTAGLIAALSGGFLAFQFGFSFNYWLSFICSILAVVFSMLLREPSKHFEKANEIAFRHIVTTAFSFFRANINALKICINAILISACIVYIDEFWQLYLEHISFSVMFFGIVSSIIYGGRILGSILSAKLLRYFKLTSILVPASFLCAFGIVLASIIQSIVGVLGLVLAISMAALTEPLVMGYLHHHADSEARATIESISSLVERIFSIVLGLFFGFVATNFGIISGFWLIGIFVSIIAVIFLFVYRSRKFSYK